MTINPASPTPNALKFMKANDKSNVVSGHTHGSGGKGGVYTLETGKSFDLSLEDCRSLPPEYPKWGF